MIGPIELLFLLLVGGGLLGLVLWFFGRPRETS